MSSDLLKYARDLDAIGQFFAMHSMPEHADLERISEQLESIGEAVQQTGSNNQEELIRRLHEQCHQLEVRRKVIDLAEAAESLANNSPGRKPAELSLEANLLRQEIHTFLQDHRPSRNNAKFLRFAMLCIDKAERNEPVIEKRIKSTKTLKLSLFEDREASPDSFVLAELLYALAADLYHEKIEEFKNSLKTQFSENSQKEIRFHIGACGGDLRRLETLEDRMHAVQGILGYAHKLTDYYMDSTPYPSLIDIHQMFEELDLVTHLEESAPLLPS